MPLSKNKVCEYGMLGIRSSGDAGGKLHAEHVPPRIHKISHDLVKCGREGGWGQTCIDHSRDVKGSERAGLRR
eukprot:1433362-Pleurochrysis_carterae.AAC.4